MKFNSKKLYDMKLYTKETQHELVRLSTIADKLSNTLTKQELDLLMDLILNNCAYEVACALDVQLYPKRYKDLLKY